MVDSPFQLFSKNIGTFVESKNITFLLNTDSNITE